MLHNRKKTIFFSLLAGACITAIPLLVLLCIQYGRSRTLSRTVARYEEMESACQTVPAYVLTRSLSAGDQITADCFAICTIKIAGDTSLNLVTDSGSIENYYAKTALKKGSVITADMFYEKDFTDSNIRTLEITDLLLPEQLAADGFVDIRISFPNGEDYVVLEKQKILYLLREDASTYGIALSLDEEDLLRLSSARVDRTLYENTCLYAIAYSADFQEPAIVDYPVNTDVFSLMQWNPNILSLYTVEREQERRSALEEHLDSFFYRETYETAVTEPEVCNISQ